MTDQLDLDFGAELQALEQEASIFDELQDFSFIKDVNYGDDDYASN